MANTTRFLACLALGLSLAGCSENGGMMGSKSTSNAAAPVAAQPGATAADAAQPSSATMAAYAEAIRKVIGQKDAAVAQTGGGGAVSPATGQMIANKLAGIDLSGTPSDFQSAFQMLVKALGSIPASSTAAGNPENDVRGLTGWMSMANVTAAAEKLEAVCQKYGITGAAGTLKP